MLVTTTENPVLAYIYRARDRISDVYQVSPYALLQMAI